MDQVREEQQRLIAEIARRYNVQLRPDDPMFVVLALNELAQERFVQRIEHTLKEVFYQISALNNEQREAAKILAERAIAGGAEYVAKTTLAAIEEFLAAVKATTANELAAIRRAGEEARKERRTVEWIVAVNLAVNVAAVAMLIGALAAAWFRGG